MSGNFFEKNLKAMEKWYPDFAEAIRQERYEKDELDIITEYSLDEKLIYRIRQGERLLYLNGKRNVEEALELWIQHLGEIHEYATVVLFGIGSGLYLKKIMAETKENVNILVYEPSVSLFLKTLELVDLENEITNRMIAFIVEGLNGNEYEPVLRKWVVIDNLEFLKQEIHPNYQELFPNQILKAVKNLEGYVGKIFSNFKTGLNFSTVTARNVLKNMRFVCEGYNTKKLCEAIPHDVPAILVAAGPSLNNDIEVLKKAKNKAFILAVDTAVKPLIKAGILPDAYITIDADKVLSLVELDEVKRLPIIAPATANYYILKEQLGKKIFYYEGHLLPFLAYNAAGKIMPGVSTGGSVACSGFSMLYKMGFETIILVGQDLAYTNNKSHADGTFQEVMPEENTAHMRMVKGNYEELVPTRGDFKMYIDWYNMYIEGAKKASKLRVINATSGGAYLENTELLPLSDAIAEVCDREVDFAQCIEQMGSEFSEEERKKVVEFLHEVPDGFERVEKGAKELIRVYRKLEKMSKSGHMNKDAYLKMLQKVKKARKKCEKEPMYQLVDATMVLAKYIVESESLYHKDSIEEEGKALAEQGLKFSELLQECATLLKEYAKEELLMIE